MRGGRTTANPALFKLAGERIRQPSARSPKDDERATGGVRRERAFAGALGQPIGPRVHRAISGPSTPVVCPYPGRLHSESTLWKSK